MHLDDLMQRHHRECDACIETGCTRHTNPHDMTCNNSNNNNNQEHITVVNCHHDNSTIIRMQPQNAIRSHSSDHSIQPRLQCHHRAQAFMTPTLTSSSLQCAV